MSPGVAVLIVEATPAVIAAGIAITVSALIQRHHERRIQHLEHEVAHLHALRDDASFPEGSEGHIDRLADPTTPEVSRRFKEMVA